MAENDDPRQPAASDWLIVGLTALSVVIYFVTSFGAKGQVLFLMKAVAKVLARLGVHS